MSHSKSLGCPNRIFTPTSNYWGTQTKPCRTPEKSICRSKKKKRSQNEWERKKNDCLTLEIPCLHWVFKEKNEKTMNFTREEDLFFSRFRACFQFYEFRWNYRIGHLHLPKTQSTASALNLSLGSAYFNFPRYVRMNGGGEGNRTPVRRLLRRAFSGCRQLKEFPQLA